MSLLSIPVLAGALLSVLVGLALGMLGGGGSIPGSSRPSDAHIQVM